LIVFDFVRVGTSVRETDVDSDDVGVGDFVTGDRVIDGDASEGVRIADFVFDGEGGEALNDQDCDLLSSGSEMETLSVMLPPIDGVPDTVCVGDRVAIVTDNCCDGLGVSNE
jgi:hypothetical protein